MIKVIADNAWDGSLWSDDTPRTTLIKRASNGSFDKYDFVKKAEKSSQELLDKVASLDVKPGEELVHLIALGTTEAYGPNRNGDGFKKKACVKYHPWFVKEARFYRNHKNTDKAKSYGIVKASAFNNEMNRVELIVALNGTEKAAQANGGLIADKEMEKLASGNPIAVSMACRVPFDVCSWCGNRATTRDEYCDADKCAAGGLKHGICKIASVNGKLHHLHADNTEPHFFDISNVFVPADRIAYSSGWLNKHASWETMSGAALAEAYNITEPVIYKQASHNPLPAGFGTVVAILKDAVQGFHDNNGWTKQASYLGAISNKALDRVHIPHMYKLGALSRALANEQTCLTPTQFIQLITNYPFEKCAEMGEIIAPLSNESLIKMSAWDLAENPYMPDKYAPEVLTSWVRSQELPSLDPRRFVKQAAFNSFDKQLPHTLHGAAIYSLVEDTSISALADQFALYKTAFVASLPVSKQEFAANVIVGRDYMSF